LNELSKINVVNTDEITYYQRTFMNEKAPKISKQTARRVFLDPSSPSIISVVRTVIIGLFLWSIWDFTIGIIASLTSLSFLLVLSVFFAYLLNPLVSLIRKPFKERSLDKFMPRSLAIVVAYLLVFTFVGLAISYLAPRLIEQAKEFAGNLPSYSEQIQTQVEQLNKKYGNYQIPEQVQTDINKKIGEMIPEIGGKITGFAGSLAINILSISPWFFLVPILAFFFLKDVNSFRISILRMLPLGRWRKTGESLLEDLNTTLAAYTRAQLISCFLIGTICTIGFYFLGVNYALLLGIVAGVLEFIPLIGPLIIGITAVTVAAFTSPTQAISTLIFLVVLRILQDYVFYPRIVREGIHLHPLAIILSVLAGEQIAGIPGVFISVPLVAVSAVIYKNIREHIGSKGLVADLLEEETEAADVGQVN
jgi:predicted PurR-regulated permease PerM